MSNPSAGLSNAQRDRIAAYRKSTHHSPDSLSDSQIRGNEAQFAGQERELDRAPPVGLTAWQSAAGSRMAFPNQQLQPQGSRGATPRGSLQGLVSATPVAPVTPPAAASLPPQRSSAGAPGMAAQGELTAYIFRLEQQNDELRQQVVSLQQRATDGSVGAGRVVAGPERSEESKREFLNDVLQQVETVITAHKNKAQAEIQKYKHEAETAQLALKNLRAAIQQEGMDLTMAPAMIAFHRKQQAMGAALPALGLQIPPEAQRLLEGLSQELLNKLVSLKSSDDVPAAVSGAVKSCFEGLVVYFTDQICQNTKFLDEANEQLKRELQEAREDVRRIDLAHEAKRIEIVTRHDAEIQALRDELTTYQRVSGDDVATNVHQRAFDEYAQLLAEARRQQTQLRIELENEKNHSAQVCLKLKAALQKRNEDFEKAVLSRAEEVVSQREKYIAELEAKLEARKPPEKRDCALQIGEPLVSVPPQELFVPHLLASVRKDPKATSNQNEMFEREVWRKTQELLTKYGGASLASSSAAASGQ